MLPHISNPFRFLHLNSRQDLPHLAIVTFLIFGIGLGVYLALQPQLFNKHASEGTIVDVAFVPETMKVEVGRDYEAKIAINPKGQRVTTVQLSISYNADVVSIVEVNNGGFLPVNLRVNDDHQGNLNIIYGSTIESQANQPGMLSVIKFKVLNPYFATMQIKPTSEVSITSKEGNVLSTYPKLLIEPQDKAVPNEQVNYPDKLLLEKAFFASSDPTVRDYTESLYPDPELKPERVKPGFSEAYVKQLGTDIFISPIAALNQVLEEKAAGVLGK